MSRRSPNSSMTPLYHNCYPRISSQQLRATPTFNSEEQTLVSMVQTYTSHVWGAGLAAHHLRCQRMTSHVLQSPPQVLNLTTTTWHPYLPGYPRPPSHQQHLRPHPALLPFPHSALSTTSSPHSPGPHLLPILPSPATPTCSLRRQHQWRRPPTPATAAS